jgi:toxin HigB-1
MAERPRRRGSLFRRISGEWRHGNWKRWIQPRRSKTFEYPPGNRLEALKGDRAGQHSIRINDQFRICFVWTDAGPEAVEIVDYH